MNRPKILVIGSANMDLSMNMYKLPESGETVVDDGGVAYIPGGRGAGAAAAFSKLGADAVLVSKLGADLHGQKLYQYFRDLGINTSYMKVDNDNSTGLSVILKEGDGGRRTIIYHGANAHISADNITDAFSCAPDAVYISLELPLPLIVTALRTAESRGIPAIVDAAPAGKDFPLESLPRVEIFSPNAEETECFTGIMPAGADTSLRAALALYKRVKCKYLIIKQGERGAFIYDGKHYYMIPPIRAGKTVDQSGVGDAFGAGMTLSYILNGDIKSAVQYGSAVGAITVTRRGGASSIPTGSEVSDFFAKYMN